MDFDQGDYEIRCEWGEAGAARLAPTSDVTIIVDVLSFSTSVEIAVQRGASVIPFRQADGTVVEFADSIGAVLADPGRRRGRLSLSPESLIHIPAGTKLVLPSPNGGTLSLAAAEHSPVLAGCLRNARAVALAAMKYGRKIAVIPAGERWKDDLSLRPAFEDWIGAGAIIHYLAGSASPEADAALAAFHRSRSRLAVLVRQCGSGRELIERGYARDVELAAQLNISKAVPILSGGIYVDGGGSAL